jgi:N-acetylneuraminic acid mutarotase
MLRVRAVAVILVALWCGAAACGGGGGRPQSSSRHASGSVAPPAPSSDAAGSTTSTPAAHGLQVAPASWQLPAPSAREVALVDGHDLVVLGGLDASKQTIATVVRVDPSTGKASREGSLSQPVHDAAGAVVHGSLLVLGGGAAAETAAVQSYSPSGTKVAGNLPQPRSDHTSAMLEGKIYVAGGFDGARIVPDVLVSDDGVSFRTLAILPEPVRYAAVAAVDGAIYVFGGVTNAQGVDTRSIQRIDAASGTVRVIGQLPAPLSHASAVVLRGRVFVLGGFASNQVTDQVLEFDPKSGAVKAQPARLPAPRSDGAVAVVGDAAYLVGGQGTDRAPVASAVQVKLV